MTREETKEAIKVMQAYVDGKDIEVVYNDGKIMEVPFPTWQWENNPTRYRIEPESHYRPFKDAEEVMEAIKGKGNILKSTFSPHYVIIQEWSDGCIWTTASAKTFEEAYDRFTFFDGTPFGKLEE